MNKKTVSIFVGALAVLLILSYCFMGKKTGKEAFPPDLPVPGPAVTPSAKTQNPTEPPPQQQASDASGFLPTKMQDAALFQLMQKNFKDMSTCLNMKTGPLSENDQFNFETLNTIIAPDLGDIVTQSEDWSSTDLKTNSGEMRRVFVQNVPHEGSTIRVLKYYSMTGGQKELPLTAEQSANPSDALVASLEGDGQLVSKSVARKIYYQNGDDLSLVERNGRVYSFQLAHDGKTFHCSGTDSSSSFSCSCK